MPYHRDVDSCIGWRRTWFCTAAGIYMGSIIGSCCIVFPNAVNSPLWFPLQLKTNVIHDGWQSGGTREAWSLLECVHGRSGDIFTLLPEMKNTLGCDCFRTINSGRKRDIFLSLDWIFMWSSTEVDLVETLPMSFCILLKLIGNCVRSLWGFSCIISEQPHSQMSAANPLTLSLYVIHSFTLISCFNPVIDWHLLAFLNPDSRLKILVSCLFPH